MFLCGNIKIPGMKWCYLTLQISYANMDYILMYVSVKIILFCVTVTVSFLYFVLYVRLFFLSVIL